jgi:hypothetical protein
MKVKFNLPERLIKLARLANNNPSEIEANRAARLVCKKLEELKYEFTLNVPSPEPPLRTYNDVRRSTEPQWSSRPAEPSVDYMNEFSRNYAKSKETRSWDTETPRNPYDDSRFWDGFYKKTPPKEPTSPYEKGAGDIPKEPPKSSRWGGRPNPGPSSNYTGEIRILKCKTCGNSKGTKFVGAEEVYECNECQWTAYMREL